MNGARNILLKYLMEYCCSFLKENHNNRTKSMFFTNGILAFDKCIA